MKLSVKRAVAYSGLILLGSTMVGYAGMLLLVDRIAPPFEVGNFQDFLPENEAGVEIAVYGTSTCLACVTARSYLMGARVRFTDINVLASENTRERFRAIGSHEVPVIFVRNRKFVGFNQTRLAKTLEEFGLAERGGVVEKDPQADSRIDLN